MRQLNADFLSNINKLLVFFHNCIIDWNEVKSLTFWEIISAWSSLKAEPKTSIYIQVVYQKKQEWGIRARPRKSETQSVCVMAWPGGLMSCGFLKRLHCPLELSICKGRSWDIISKLPSPMDDLFTAVLIKLPISEKSLQQEVEKPSAHVTVRSEHPQKLLPQLQLESEVDRQMWHLTLQEICVQYLQMTHHMPGKLSGSTGKLSAWSRCGQMHTSASTG